MDNKHMIDMALEHMLNEVEGMEGKSAMMHDAESCPDPENCDMHMPEMSMDKELPVKGGEMHVEIESHKMHPEEMSKGGEPSLKPGELSDKEHDWNKVPGMEKGGQVPHKLPFDADSEGKEKKELMASEVKEPKINTNDNDLDPMEIEELKKLLK
jgi:hypothetical protein